jgi:hypothetical protein
MEQNRRRMQDEPNRQSNMEPAEGSRETANDSMRNSESGQDLGTSSDRAMMTDRQSEQRHRTSEEDQRPGGPEQGRDNAGGITNRDLEREMSEQEQLPPRGRSGPER